MYKNIVGQKIAIFAWNGATGTPANGDAANITAWYGQDGSALLGTDDVNPVEIGFGVYIFDLTQNESNCDLLVWAAESTTADIDIKPIIVYTQDLTRVSTHNATDVKTEMEATGSKLTDIKNRTDLMNFVGDDVKATLDGEETTTDTISREASKATGFSTHNAADVQNEIIEGTLTAREVQRLLLSFVAGQTTGGGSTTVEFKNQTGSTSRITMIVDDSGNRSATVLNVA